MEFDARQAPAIALTSADGATIRYTLDGTDPTVASSLYVALLTMGEGTTILKAKAFQTDWTPSETLVETYRVDLTPPTITARVAPAPLETGWHSTDVTITFTCTDASGVPDCPAPVVVTQEGAGQVVTRTAIDAVGHQANATVTVNLDRTPGAVSLGSPLDGATTDAPSIALTGQVSDALSGITSATCNGVPATVLQGQVECTVDLLPGRNSVVLHARDAAGNGISTGVRVTRGGPITRLRIDPGRRTLLVGESQPLTVVDEYGRVVEGATWASSNSGVAAVAVSAAGPPPPISEQGAAHMSATGAAASAKGLATAAAARARSGGNQATTSTATASSATGAAAITAVAAGEVTITANAAGITTEATVVVADGASLPSGATRWSAASTPGLEMRAVYTHRVDETVPDLFGAERDPFDPQGHAVSIRALTASGRSLWTEASPGDPVYGDSFGGLVAEVRDPYGEALALARFAGPATAPPWRYESPGFTFAGAQAPDGTIYTSEVIGDDGYILVLDGQTGRVRARVPLPRRFDIYQLCDGNGYSFENPPISMPPIVGADGNGYVQVLNFSHKRYQTSCPGGPTVKEVDITLTLRRIQPTGVVSSETLYEFHATLPNGACEPFAWPYSLLADGLGGTIASWSLYSSCSADFRITATRFGRDGVRADHVITTNPVNSGADVVLTGDGGTAYVSAGGFISAVEVATWSTKWSIGRYVGEPAIALDDGGVAFYYQGIDTVTVVDGDGNITGSTSMSVDDPKSLLFLGEWLGTERTTGALNAIVGPSINQAMFSFVARDRWAEGNPQGQNAPNVQATITINTFIPEEWIDNPAEWLTRRSTWWTSIFEGDYRGFDINGSSRSKQRVIVTPLGLGAPSQTIAGWTRLYDLETSLDADGHLTAAARADTIVGDDQMLLAVARSADQATATAMRLPDGKVQVTLRYAGNNPLVNLGDLNAITYDVTLTIDFAAMTYQLAGGHDGFPNYEIYIGRRRIHHHDHGSYGVEALLPGLEINFDHPAVPIQP